MSNGAQTQTQGFWLGPYDIRVPTSTTEVTAADGVNVWTRDASQRPANIVVNLDRNEYLQRFACRGADGHYYWNGDM